MMHTAHKCARHTHDANAALCAQAFIRKYIPLAVIIMIVLLVLWLRSKFYS